MGLEISYTKVPIINALKKADQMSGTEPANKGYYETDQALLV